MKNVSAATTAIVSEISSASAPLLAETSVPVLCFRDLRKTFGGQTVLDGISGEIRPGEIILLRGENGSGKTTLLNILTGCLEPDAGEIEIFDPESPISHRTFTFPSPWYSDLNPFQQFTPERVARLGVGRTWQDVRLFGSLDLADNIAVAEPDGSDSPWTALFRPRKALESNRLHRKSAANTLEELGFGNRNTSSADRISLGQSKRVAIARALHASARVLFLDEPLSGLDANGIRDVLAHLRVLSAKYKLTLVIIEHVLNIPHLLDFVTSVWNLQGGRLQHDVASIVPPTESAQSLVIQSLPDSPKITTYKLFRNAAMTMYQRDHSTESSQVLEVKDLILQRGPHRLFEQLSGSGLTFRLCKDTVTVLEAPNGWGKSSLLLCLTGFAKASSGHFRFDNNSKSGFTSSQTVTALPTDNTLFPSLTVAETCNLVKRPLPKGLDAGRRVSSLSGGEHQKLAIACLRPASLIILDEFFHGLDYETSILLLRHILSFSQNSCLLLLEPSSQQFDKPIKNL